MKKAIWIIAGLVLIVIGTKAALFFYNYDRLTYHYMYIVICVGLIIAGFYIIKYIQSGGGDGPNEQEKSRILNLKKTGEKITVDLSTCRIEDYTPESGEKVSVEVRAWSITKADYKGNITQSVLVCDLDGNGHKGSYRSDVLTLDRVGLTFKLVNQKTTILYIDPYDPANYYLDTEFLFKKTYH